MLPRKQRISKALARDVFIRGNNASSAHFLLKTLPSPGSDTRFAVSVSKKVAPNAVDRNRTRRRVYSVIRPLTLHVRSGFLVGVSVKKGGDKISFELVTKEVRELLVRSRILSV